MHSAVQLYSSALEADSTVALFYAKRAAAYQSLNKLGQALRDLDSALEVDGNYSTGYLHRGKLHRCEPALSSRHLQLAIGWFGGVAAAL
jgi:tetratricopeptide (TPR) repeat protein